MSRCIIEKSIMVSKLRENISENIFFGDANISTEIFDSFSEIKTGNMIEDQEISEEILCFVSPEGFLFIFPIYVRSIINKYENFWWLASPLLWSLISDVGGRALRVATIDDRELVIMFADWIIEKEKIFSSNNSSVSSQIEDAICVKNLWEIQ